jgi:hypothetical protein
MLNYVRAGAYLHVAAAAIGVAPDTISRWLKKGENARNGSDYSRFRRYVLSAVAEASLVAEAQVKQSKPETWLRCGPRRLLGDEWREADGSANAAVNIESATIVTSPSRADLAAALLELHKAGICLPAADAAFVQSDRRYLPEPSPPQLPFAYAMQRDEPKAGVGPSVYANWSQPCLPSLVIGSPLEVVD